MCVKDLGLRGIYRDCNGDDGGAMIRDSMGLLKEMERTEIKQDLGCRPHVDA